MATAVSFRHGTTTQHESFEGVEAEITVATDEKTLYVHDGSGEPGTPLAREDLLNVDKSSITRKGILDTFMNNFQDGDWSGSYADNKNIPLGRSITDYLDLHNNLDLDNYALANLSNVQGSDVTQVIGDSAYVKYNMSNAQTDILAGVNPGLPVDKKPLAYKDTSNINNADLANTTFHDGTNGNLPVALNDLSNINLDATSTSQMNNLNFNGIQTKNKLVDLNSATSSDQYPSATSVKSEINTLKNTPKILSLKISDITTGVLTVTTSSVANSINIKYLISSHGTTISGTWSGQGTTTRIFTPTIPSDIINESWVIELS